ncbi:hypothetical protein [Streptomyces fragilis]|uniref:Uncharacterized protein n=1 Tax=Streptomyces fragilis TaxID=67301 RepID=A0ABV2YCU8_9ACTN|nr:hypothetical protein [Streptomyces fragilis]
MSKLFRSMAGRVAGALLPQTSAAAGCASDCTTHWEKTGSNQVYKMKCCYRPDCTYYCVPA